MGYVAQPAPPPSLPAPQTRLPPLKNASPTQPSPCPSLIPPLPTPPRSIKQLTKLINENCPAAVKEQSLAELNGRKIAIDASMVRAVCVWMGWDEP